MIKLRLKKSDWAKTSKPGSYSRNFSLALLNWETNRQETRFAFHIFDNNGNPVKKQAV